MATKELTKRLLKGLGTCENCKFGIKIEFWTNTKWPTPSAPGSWTMEKDGYSCLKKDSAEVNMTFCETEWEKQDIEPSKEFMGASLTERYAIRTTFNRNLLNQRKFRKKVNDLRYSPTIILSGEKSRKNHMTVDEFLFEIKNALDKLNTQDKNYIKSTEDGQGLHFGFGMWLRNRSEERRVGKECRSRWSPYH